MPQVRTALRKIDEGKKNVVRFRHPLKLHPKTGRPCSVRFDLGDDANWRKNLEALNEIFLNEANWRTLPPGTPDLIRRQWMPKDNTVAAIGHGVRKGGKDQRVDHKRMTIILAENEGLRRRLDAANAQIEKLTTELEHYRGKPRATAFLSLEAARKKFMAEYTGKDSEATANIGYSLSRFVAKFGENTAVRKMEGNEAEITAWLNGLRSKNNPEKYISGSRRNNIRLYVLKMLALAGAVIDRKKIPVATKKEIKRTRGAIKYLPRDQAEKVAEKLQSPWKEMFQIQVSIGLRPDELLTLHRSNFNPDCSKLVLSPLGALTLKTGSRPIPIPKSIRPVIEWRLRTGGDVLFTEPKTGKPWRSARHFNRRFGHWLQKAADDSGLKVDMDCRIGRRTCASLLLQDNVSAEKIAALLGNTPGMILSHYGDPDVEKLGDKMDANVVGLSTKSA